MTDSTFSLTLIDWYNQHKRALPWRETNDPYKIWLSEIILQQTRVDQGLPYYYRFTERFPDVNSLAQAGEQEVLSLWQGLGYYSRARNLYRCACLINSKLNGLFPSNYKELLHLPGIGKYTAAAIASFAFMEKVPVVDGNVARVLSRYFGIYDDIANSKTFQKFFELSASLMSEANPDLYNQAIMEFGALQCTPRKPNCAKCPLATSCFARIEKKQAQLPVKINKVKVKKRYFRYLVMHDQESILMKKRVEKDIWQNMFDFPIIGPDNTDDIEKCMHELDHILQKKELSPVIDSEVKHILTHQKIHAVFIRVETDDVSALQALFPETEPFSIKNTPALPKPVLIDNYLTKLFF